MRILQPCGVVKTFCLQIPILSNKLLNHTMSDEYGSVARGKLKLKSDGSGDIQKKSKKKRRDKDKLKSSAEQSIREEMSESQAATGGRTDGPASSSASRRTLTKAEVAFKQMQEKTQKKRILEKASQTHKQRVEKFNQHLDSLTEHYDIPKVSWTK